MELIEFVFRLVQKDSIEKANRNFVAVLSCGHIDSQIDFKLWNNLRKEMVSDFD